jgi:biopolymer transport protein ExbD
MGMSVGQKQGGVQSEINVTPLIDVLLVLLIIFLVVMPIMMKMETLQVPRSINDNEAPDPNASLLTVKVKADMSVVFNDGDKDQPIQAVDLAKTLRPKLEAMHAGSEKVVFVDFEDAVPWNQVVSTMDTIRSLAADINHDEIKVALKVREDQPANKPQ